MDERREGLKGRRTWRKEGFEQEGRRNRRTGDGARCRAGTSWLLGVAILIASPLGAVTAADEPGWVSVDVPKAWEQGGGGAPRRGFVWYRCRFQAPESWSEGPVELFLEGLDDAREIYVNGRLTGRLGEMPPAYRSGLGDLDRHGVAGESLRFGEINELAVRVYRNDSREGLSVGAPVLMGGKEALSLAGRWRQRVGDGADWATDAQAWTEQEDAVFFEISARADAESGLKRLREGDGARTPEESWRLLRPAEGLAVDLVLSEPEIAQPLAIRFDGRGRMWVAEYRQYPHPAGLRMVSRDAYLRTVYDRMPPPPPHAEDSPFRGNDRISIHEDADGDGIYESHRVFVEGLNLATSFAIGGGGVWVLNPPYLLFYADRDGDDLADGDPEVRLEGFGIEDTHSVVNSLRWGPDGWLYAAQGSTVTANVRAPGSAQEGMKSMGQLIWRYHPEKRRYEVFAEGGGNAFGVEFDAHGRLFSGHNGGNTRGFHYVPGAYLQKGFGKHGELSNPYAFGYFGPMEHHEATRFTHTFVVYEEGRLPGAYEGRLFGVEPLQGRVVIAERTARGSTFSTRDLGYALESEDPWFRPVEIQPGPDGALYVADFYEQRIDHGSHYQGRVDAGSGRIYRLRSRDAALGGGPATNLEALSGEELASRLKSPQRWMRQAALAVLGDRREPGMAAKLRERLREETGAAALEFLWALYRSGGFEEEDVFAGLAHVSADVRLWTARLACDRDEEMLPEIIEALGKLCEREPEVEVRMQLACCAARLNSAAALRLVRALADRAEDAADPYIPLLLWWAVESALRRDLAGTLEAVQTQEFQSGALFSETLAPRVIRRFAEEGGRENFSRCLALIATAVNVEIEASMIGALETATAGRSESEVPEEVWALLAKRGGTSLAARLRRGEREAVEEALRRVGEESVPGEERTGLIDSLGRLREGAAVPVLLAVVEGSGDDGVRRAALQALGSFDAPAIPASVLPRLGSFPETLRESAALLLASRGIWAEELAEALQKGEVASSHVPVAAARRLALALSGESRERVSGLWEELSKSPAGEPDWNEVERLEGVVGGGTGNPYRGRELYRERCAACHRLFAEGGEIGPELTSYQRRDLRALLLNLVHPSGEIREGYESMVLTTGDGRVLTGFLLDQDARSVVLRGPDGQTLGVERAEIVSLEAVPVSLMPEGLLRGLIDQEIRDFMAYLRSGQPLPDP
ncbi:MAG TPA: PVC-type heme-binding CxxCH protein [Verrucomicrobiales bacterium]|nr:PVC-type heme-binding CxxCH protein [Verrucomicrobiales bacterium]